MVSGFAGFGSKEKADGGEENQIILFGWRLAKKVVEEVLLAEVWCHACLEELMDECVLGFNFVEVEV